MALDNANARLLHSDSDRYLMFIQVSVAFFVFLWQRDSMPRMCLNVERISEKNRENRRILENFREL